MWGFALKLTFGSIGPYLVSNIQPDKLPFLIVQYSKALVQYVKNT